MNAYVLSVGDELVAGLTVNTNATWLSAQLSALGITTLKQVTVNDSQESITAAIREAADNADIVMISGGLGPTEDDLTRQALAAAMREKLIEDPAALAELQQWFGSRQRVLSPSNLVQARRPESARCLTNHWGTAPGLRAQLKKSVVYVVPGVPREMKGMFEHWIRPDLKTMSGGAAKVTLATKVHTFGRGESVLGEEIADLMVRGGREIAGAHVTVGTTVADGIVSVRIYATGSPAQAQEATSHMRAEILTRLGPLVYGENDDTLEAAVATILTQRGATIATAESCTGGLLAQMLTEIPGSSRYFQRGWVTYSNQSKTEELGVPADLINQEGAVSQAVAQAMAEGARKNAAVDWALSTTGIAGPDGGSPEKPVGTVWIALAGPHATLARRHIFPGARTQIRQRTAQMALTMLRCQLLGIPWEKIIR